MWRFDGASIATNGRSSEKRLPARRRGINTIEGGHAFYQLLWGPFQIINGDHWIFPSELMQQLDAIDTEPFPRRDVEPPGPQMSLLALAKQLAGVLGSGDLGQHDSREVVIRDVDSDFELYIDRSGADVVLSSNLFVAIGLPRSPDLTIPREELADAIRLFLTDFAAMVADQASEILSWHSFMFLRDFLPDRGGRSA